MVEVTHTPGPWFIDDRHDEIEIVGRPGEGYRRLGEVGKWTVATIDGDDLLPDGQAKANARRIVACVNALAGYNPSELATLIEAALAMRQSIREAGVKRHPALYEKVMLFDGALARFRATDNTKE